LNMVLCNDYYCKKSDSRLRTYRKSYIKLLIMHRADPEKYKRNHNL
jgi:hypothetical protein